MPVTEKPFAPIVLFVYNRLGHTRQTVQALQENDFARESELFIYSDGPKDDIHSKVKVEEVRSYIKSITGFKKITIVERQHNIGLADSIIHGVTDIVNRYGKVIVIEDDLDTSPDFLRFMNEALVAYNDEPQVMQISGHMFDVKIKAETDAVFLPFTTSWGWATWKRAWDYFDPFMSGYKKIKNDTQLKYRFNLEGAYNYFNMLEGQLHGRVDSWAIRWYLSVFLNNGFTLFPIRSLVHNIGFDGSGTHCGGSATARAALSLSLFEKKVFHFPGINIDQEAFANVRFCLSQADTLCRNGKPISPYKVFQIKMRNFFENNF